MDDSGGARNKVFSPVRLRLGFFSLTWEGLVCLEIPYLDEESHDSVVHTFGVRLRLYNHSVGRLTHCKQEKK